MLTLLPRSRRLNGRYGEAGVGRPIAAAQHRRLSGRGRVSRTAAPATTEDVRPC
jgi:hypothetical protein